MKKTIIFLTLILLSISLISCSEKSIIEPYDDTTFGYIDINKDDIKILQLTDLHLTYGFDYLDKKTYKLIDKLIKYESPDVIVITGDVTMTIIAKNVIKQFIIHMDKYNIPWTFLFGNHEADYHNIESIVKVIYKIKTKNLYFHPGPILSNNNTHGASNFKLKITNGNKPILNLYLLDSKANRIDGVVDEDFPYDYLSIEQVKWYKEEVETDLVDSLLFVHIPLMQYLEYDGQIGEKIWPQGKDTGLFNEIITNNKTLGVFVGHDHLNDFEFIYEGILLAYGRNTGYNAYGTDNKGARVITYNFNSKALNTYIVLDSEVMKWKTNYL